MKFRHRTKLHENYPLPEMKSWVAPLVYSILSRPGRESKSRPTCTEVDATGGLNPNRYLATKITLSFTVDLCINCTHAAEITHRNGNKEI